MFQEGEIVAAEIYRYGFRIRFSFALFDEAATNCLLILLFMLPSFRVLTHISQDRKALYCCIARSVVEVCFVFKNVVPNMDDPVVFAHNNAIMGG